MSTKKKKSNRSKSNNVSNKNENLCDIHFEIDVNYYYTICYYRCFWLDANLNRINDVNKAIKFNTEDDAKKFIDAHRDKLNEGVYYICRYIRESVFIIDNKFNPVCFVI